MKLEDIGSNQISSALQPPEVTYFTVDGVPTSEKEKKNDLVEN